MARSRSTHEYSPRNRTPKTAPRPKVERETLVTVLASSDPRGVGLAKLQRLTDGTYRLLPQGHMGRGATHGYEVDVLNETDRLTLITSHEPSDLYDISSDEWDKLHDWAA